MRTSKNTYIIGLDEVGRGPLAGPVAVGGVFCMPGFEKSPLPLPQEYSLRRAFIKGENQRKVQRDDNWMSMITDSKKLNAKKREYLTEQLLSCPDIIWATSFVSAKYIDRHGIVAAIRKASLNVIDQIIKKATPLLGDGWEQDLEILLDGKTDYGLKKTLFSDRALPHFVALRSPQGDFFQGAQGQLKTIIKGDSLIREIGAASIIAKVQRDEYMTKLAHKKKYQFYGFDRHKGYGTLLHRTVIEKYGLSCVHRVSFCKNINISNHLFH